MPQAPDGDELTAAAAAADITFMLYDDIVVSSGSYMIYVLCIHIHTYIHVYIYIYIERERERTATD